MKSVLYCLLLSTCLGLLSSCTEKRVYYKYCHTPIAGWEKNDTLLFNIPRMTKAGIYKAELGLRINGDYPFMNLTLIVSQTIYPGHKIKADTLNCHLISANGMPKGQGLNTYQYNFPLPDTSLNQGDSLCVSIKHDMKREILPGVSDVGFMLAVHP